MTMPAGDDDPRNDMPFEELSNAEVVASADASEQLDLSVLQTSLATDPILRLTPDHPLARTEDTHAIVLELAEDMLQLTRRLQGIEQTQAQVIARLDQLD